MLALVGVVKHADIGPNGTPGGWAELHRTPPGDPRASSQNNLWLEFLGDYVYAVATNTYGAAVWNDTRNGADCPAIDAWRAAAQVNPAHANVLSQSVVRRGDVDAAFVLGVFARHDLSWA